MARYTDNQAKEIFASNLQRIMDDRGIDAPTLAGMIGLEKQAVYSWMKRRSFPSTTNIQRLIEALRVTSDDLLAQHGGTSSALAPVPLYGSVAAGTPVEMIQIEEMREAPARFLEDDPDCYLVRVRGNSMNRAIPDGSFALVSPRHAEMNERDMFLVAVNSDDATIKRLSRLENGVALIPDSYDPTYRPQLLDFGDDSTPQFRVLGKVVWWCKEF